MMSVGIQERPLVDNSSDEEVGIGDLHGGATRGIRSWIAMTVAAFVVVLATASVFSTRSTQDRLVIAKVSDAISESHYSQTVSYKCNVQHEEELQGCTDASGSGDGDEANATATDATVSKCREMANNKYRFCCQDAPRQRCSFPCSETCQQKFGTMTADYTTCCQKCPGRKCVDPWQLLVEFW